MSFHNEIICEIVRSKSELAEILELRDLEVVDNVSLSSYGDIDLIAKGVEINSGRRIRAIIEVKSHEGLVAAYRNKQLPKYKERFPDFKQYVAYSINGKSEISNLVFKRQ